MPDPRKKQLKTILKKRGYVCDPFPQASREKIYALYLGGDIYEPEALVEYTYLGAYYHIQAKVELALATFQRGEELGCLFCRNNRLACQIEFSQEPPHIATIYSSLCDSKRCLLSNHLHQHQEKIHGMRKIFTRLVQIAEDVQHDSKCPSQGTMHYLLGSYYQKKKERAKHRREKKQFTKKMIEYYQRSCQAGYTEAMNAYGHHLLLDSSTEHLGFYYLTKSHQLGNDEASEALLGGLHQRENYSEMIDLATELIQANRVTGTAHYVLSHYYAKVVKDEAKMRYHGEQSLDLSLPHLNTWYRNHLSIEAFKFALRYDCFDIWSTCLTALPLTKEYRHLLLSIHTSRLSSTNQALKQMYVEDCYYFCRYTPSYFFLSSLLRTRHCSADFLFLPRLTMNSSKIATLIRVAIRNGRGGQRSWV